VEWLYHDLSSNAALAQAGITISRVGDAVAPRRAHAAVIDGERIGSSF